ncbi:hypothetical protein PsYK624_059090 [Phanerochaete sordida]|uniref:Uncharacterized protein n=1 Tax=Phanerochaete sordida TaxID=48140 RepID=A0A9P3LBT1_9APHY|nr:hypothetical protein PsYK624_059090 [Phanerochaete sordida]
MPRRSANLPNDSRVLVTMCTLFEAVHSAIFGSGMRDMVYEVLTPSTKAVSMLAQAVTTSTFVRIVPAHT